MKKTNFEKIAKEPPFARPPMPHEMLKENFGAARSHDGRSARRTGRTVQFATVVSEEFKRWMKLKAAASGKTQAALLDDMKAAYIKVYGE
jgi:hypothetical protein